jgi:hypothetical protein
MYYYIGISILSFGRFCDNSTAKGQRGLESSITTNIAIPERQ